MVDPDLQIRGGPGHPDPEIRGGGGLKEILLGPSCLRLGLKISGEPGPLGPLPWIRH